MDSNEHPDIPNPSQYPDASFNVSPSTPGAPLYASTSAGYNFQTTSASSANPRYPFHPLSATPAGNTFLSPNAAYTSRPRNPTLHAINNISSIDTSFSPPTNIDHTQSSSPSNAFTPLTSKNTTHPRRSTRAGLRLTSSPSPGSSTLSGGVTKSRPSSVTGGKLLREKRTLIPITDSMTPAEKAAAKQENYRLRNGDSAAKSRIRKTMAVVEGALAARGYAADVEMLLELLRESERVMGSCGIHSTWEGVKMGVMERYGLEFHEGRDIKEVLFRRDEGVLGLLADPEEARKELEGKVVSGELVVHGLAFADAVARLVGKETGDVPTYRMVVAKQELRERIAAAAKAREEGRGEVESLRERLEARVKKVRKAEEEMPALRATAMRYGQEEYFASCFKGVEGAEMGGVETTSRLAPDSAAQGVAGQTLSPAETNPNVDFATLLPEPIQTGEFSSASLQADGWLQEAGQHGGDFADLGDFMGWSGGDTVDPSLLQLPGDQDFKSL